MATSFTEAVSESTPLSPPAMTSLISPHFSSVRGSITYVMTFPSSFVASLHGSFDIPILEKLLTIFFSSHFPVLKTSANTSSPMWPLPGFLSPMCPPSPRVLCSHDSRRSTNSSSYRARDVQTSPFPLYFFSLARSRMALVALMSWYLIAEASFIRNVIEVMRTLGCGLSTQRCRGARCDRSSDQ